MGIFVLASGKSAVGLLKHLKPAAIVAATVYFQIKFPGAWKALGLASIEDFGRKTAPKKWLSYCLLSGVWAGC
jgi:hypothetical protein